MADELQRIADLLKQLNQKLDELPSSLKIAAKQVFASELSQITSNAGVLTSGEFRSGNGKEPGEGFTGVRIAYPPTIYDGNNWNLSVIKSDKLQVGANTDGNFYAAGGNLIIGENGLLMNELGFPIRFDVTTDSNRRIGTLGMKVLEGDTVPTLELSYSNPSAGSNVVTYGSFETGDYTGWTKSGDDYTTISNVSPYSGSNSLYYTTTSKLPTLPAANTYLTSSRYGVSENTPYEVSYYEKYSPYGCMTFSVKWYDDSTGGNLLRTDIFYDDFIQDWHKRINTFVSPAGAQSVEIVLNFYNNGSHWIDEIDIHSVSLYKSLTFEPDVTHRDGNGNSFITPPPLCVVKKTNFTVSSGTILQRINFDDAASEIKDTDSMFDAGEADYLITPSRSGIYLISGSVTFPSNSTGIRRVAISNSSSFIYDRIITNEELSSNDDPILSVATIIECDGDSFGLNVAQTSGGNLNVNATFSVLYIGNYNA